MGRNLLAMLICLCLLPLGASQSEPGIYNPEASTPTTMYLHINGFQDFPINTQKPSDIYASDVRVGSTTHSMCIESPAGSMTSNSYHTWYGYSSPSIVEYDVDDGGKPVIHQERGLGYDILFDQNVEPVFKWFMVGAVPAESPNGTNPDAAHPPIPNVVVRTIVRQGDEISVENAAFNTGQIVAQGQTPPTTLAGQATQQSDFVKVHDLRGKHLYEFTIPLSFEKSEIDKEESYNIRVDAFIEEPLCDGPQPGDTGDYMMADYLLVHTSPDFRPRLDWAIMNPLMIETLHPMFVGDDIVVHTESNSPWGSYDVQGDLPTEQQMVLEIDGPSPALSVTQLEHQAHTRGHHKHTEPVMVVYEWDYMADQAKPGIYTFTFKVRNDQDNAEAVAVSTFQIGDGGEGKLCSKGMDDDEVVCEEATTSSENKESPGLPIIGLLGALGVAWSRRP